MEILGFFLFEGLKCLRQAGWLHFLNLPNFAIPTPSFRRFHIEALDLIQQEKLW